MLVIALNYILLWHVNNIIPVTALYLNMNTFGVLLKPQLMCYSFVKVRYRNERRFKGIFIWRWCVLGGCYVEVFERWEYACFICWDVKFIFYNRGKGISIFTDCFKNE